MSQSEPGVPRPPGQQHVVVLRFDKDRAGFYVALGAAALIAIGSFLPWVSGIASVSGIHGDGQITLGLAAGAFLFAIMGRSRDRVNLLAAVCGAATLAVAIYDGQNIQGKLKEAGPFAQALEHVGAGVYLVGIAGAVLIGAAAWQWRVQAQRATEARLGLRWDGPGPPNPPDPTS